MVEPTRLPSGQVVDRKNILRHLLSDKTNPFTRQPLKVEELVPGNFFHFYILFKDVDLKARIDAWVKDKLCSKNMK